MAIFTKTPNGWNPWTFLQTSQKTKDGKRVHIPCVNFPFDYLPADAFWMQAFTTHSYWPHPWATVAKDPFSTFLAGGGASGSIVGSFGGLALVALEMTVPIKYSWGIGREYRAGPQMGYCVGDSYCELAYTSTELARIGSFAGTIMLQNTSNEVFHRARLERMYVDHGEVRGYNPQTNVLTLDVEAELPSDDSRDISSLILTIRHNSIAEGDSRSSTINVLEILPNFQLRIDTPMQSISAGDMYIFNQPLCIKDPYLLTGFYLGTENSNPRLRPLERHLSGKDLHVTSKNAFSFFVTFTGVYVLKKTLDNSEEEGEEGEEEVEGGIVLVRPGASFIDSGNTKWHWIKGDNYDLSEVYKDTPERYGEFTSYVEEEIDQNEEGVETVAYRRVETRERVEGSDSDINSWIDSGATFIRLEIDVGGSQSFNNWHSPILSKCWLNQGGRWFKILAQPFGNVIDVSLLDVTGEARLEIKGGGKIFNQYGWFIVEHHMETSQRDFLEGYVDILSKNTMTLNISSGFTRATTVSNSRLFNPEELGNENSFFNRFLLDTASPGGCKKVWNKLDSWKVEFQDGTVLPIKKISFDGNPIPIQNSNSLSIPTSSFSVAITTGADIPNTESRTARVVFGEPYARLGRAVRSGILEAKFDEGANASGMVSVVGHMDWLSSPIEVNIPSGTVVGVCGGMWWGVADFASSISPNSLPMLFTTRSRPQGLSSFYNKLNQEGNIYYKDKLTGKITLRKGELGLREAPKRIELSYGLADGEVVADKFPIEFDSVKFERVKSISMTVAETGGGSKGYEAFSFYLGAKGSFYGNLIAGKGPVDLQALRHKNIPVGGVTTDSYKYKGLFTSPIYMYSKGPSNNKRKLFAGMSTKDGPIWVTPLLKDSDSSAELSDIKIKYVRENQTIENVGFFDAHQINDGEHLFIYGAPTPSFKIDGKPENDKGNDTEWKNKNSIFILGSSDEGEGWGMPVVRSVKNEEQWPLMLLTGVEYLNSIYLSHSNSIGIFFRGTNAKGYPYLGSYFVDLLNIPYYYALCEAEPNSNFLWRPPALSEKDYDWTAEDNIPSVKTDDSYTYGDKIYKILGQEGTGSQILHSDDQWGIITTNVSQDGILRLFYDDDEGVKMLYSRSNGTSWIPSRIIVARDATSGLFLGDCLFYITPFGIEMKILNSGLWNNAYKAKRGIGDNFVESIQEFFDTSRTRLIGSGQIDAQRISGYVDQEGGYYIFYVDSENNLSSLASKDLLKWDFTQNF